jgi:glutaminase
MSKPFVFALALDTLGAARVESVIGSNRRAIPSTRSASTPKTTFNPMVNTGAIACSGLIHEAKGDAAFDYIRQALGRFAGRDLDVDDAVYSSESRPATATGRSAIAAHRAVIRDNVAAVLEVYFRQCAILVTARVSRSWRPPSPTAASIPVTGEQVLSAYAISRTLSVMTSSGMYDYAGEWIYRIGIPARAASAAASLRRCRRARARQLFAENSTSTATACAASRSARRSAHYDLHMLNRSDDARNSIIADYDIGNSRRGACGAHTNRTSWPRTTRTFASSNWWERCRFPMSIMSRGSLRPSRGRNSSFSTCAVSRP